MCLSGKGWNYFSNSEDCACVYQYFRNISRSLLGKRKRLTHKLEEQTSLKKKYVEILGVPTQ